MKNIGDIFRSLKSKADDLFIASTGRKIIHFERILSDCKANKDADYIEAKKTSYSTNGTTLRCFYEIPVGRFHPFGLDAPDEMTVTFGMKTLLKTLGKLPYPGDLFTDDTGSQWKAVSRYVKDNSGRVMVVMTRFMQSKT